MERQCDKEESLVIQRKMKPNVESIVAHFGAQAKEKLTNLGASGEPEDQLRAPFERLLTDLAELCSMPKASVVAVGESALKELKTRPDYAVTVSGLLVGSLNSRQPGKGADPRRFKDPHDKAQWEKLRSLPNLVYTDGNAFSLWRNGELQGSVLRLIGDIEASGSELAAPLGFLGLFEDFLEWQPIPPRSAKELAQLTARLCRLLRDEVTEQLALKNEALTGLATDWRKILFPEATDEEFADGYAQALTFGLLTAREADEGEGAVQAAIQAAIPRLIAFEMQLGPFAVAQLRILAEIVALTGAPPVNPVPMFVTDTLGNPDDEGGWIPQFLGTIANSRKDANKIKRETPVTVVLGNPPYKEKAKGKGGWVEGEDAEGARTAPLTDWMPPRVWGAGTHSKHLRNLYVYFWRWATWKVYDHGPGDKTGIVCFITVAGFLGGPGFQKMRDYLRRTCDDIWILDCTPEGHQPEVNTPIFQGVQQPICIVLASRSPKSKPDAPARVRFRTLADGHRTAKFEALGKVTLSDDGWMDCPVDWRAPFLPASTGAWSTHPGLEDLFIYNGSGVMPGRTWIIAPDAESLHRRWKRLVDAPSGEEKETLFHPHLLGGKVGDKHSNRSATKVLAGQELRLIAVAADKGTCVYPVRYGFRSFDREWIIPDIRLINRPNPTLWDLHSEKQIFLTVLERSSPTAGPALTITSSIPDLDHYRR